MFNSLQSSYFKCINCKQDVDGVGSLSTLGEKRSLSIIVTCVVVFLCLPSHSLQVSHHWLFLHHRPTPCPIWELSVGQSVSSGLDNLHLFVSIEKGHCLPVCGLCGAVASEILYTSKPLFKGKAACEKCISISSYHCHHTGQIGRAHV